MRALKKKILTIFIVIISVTAILIIADSYWRYHQYVEMSKPKIKENLTEEEMEIIYKELGLLPSEKYKIEAIYFQFTEEIRAYIPVGEDLEEFLKEVCGWSEEDIEKTKKEIYCDGEVKREYSLRYRNMFENEVLSVNVDLRESGYCIPEIYIWQEKTGYVVEIVRDDGYFENSQKIKEMFPELQWKNEIEWIQMVVKEIFLGENP